MKKLVIVESPVKAEKIQKFLGNNYQVLSSKGHITDLAKGGKFGLGVDLENGFKPRYVLMSDKVDILDKLIKAAKECDEILIASDPDREGEAIAWHLKERLQDTEKPIKRFTYREITKKAITTALNQVRDIDMNLFHAQEARRILDRVVGFTVSPFLSSVYKNTLSAGRVQSVVTRMIIDREAEINSFNPETFWTINVALQHQQQSFTAKYENKILDENTSKQITSTLSNNNAAKYVVTEIISAEEKKFPPAPLVTSTLQQIMSKQFGVSADRTMKAAQSLYENGYCTYIRTDSVRTEEDALKDLRDWLQQNNYTVPTKSYVYKNKEASQDAHECIRPTDLNLPPDNMAIIDPDEKKVYETIWKYFVASQMMPAIFSTLKVTLSLQNNTQFKIKTSGKAIKSLGYLEILGGNVKDKIDIPPLNKGDIVGLFGNDPVKCEKKQTQPPSRYSESDLIKELEKREIGRPATYAEILSKICSRNYVEKKGNVYHPTELGKEITKVLVSHFPFMDYLYTSDLEKQLDEIAEGKKNHIDMLNSFYSPFKTQLHKAYLANGADTCPKCSSPLIIKGGKDKKWLGCTNHPVCKFSKNLEVNVNENNTNSTTA